MPWDEGIGVLNLCRLLAGKPLRQAVARHASTLQCRPCVPHRPGAGGSWIDISSKTDMLGGSHWFPSLT